LLLFRHIEQEAKNVPEVANLDVPGPKQAGTAAMPGMLQFHQVLIDAALLETSSNHGTQFLARVEPFELNRVVRDNLIPRYAMKLLHSGIRIHEAKILVQ